MMTTITLNKGTNKETLPACKAKKIKILATSTIVDAVLAQCIVEATVKGGMDNKLTTPSKTCSKAQFDHSTASKAKGEENPNEI